MRPCEMRRMSPKVSRPGIYASAATLPLGSYIFPSSDTPTRDNSSFNMPGKSNNVKRPGESVLLRCLLEAVKFVS
jgi:hypothetical protein